MNIIKTETPFLVEAKTTGCNDKNNRNVTYHFIESAHTLCLDRGELLRAQVKSSQRLLKISYEQEIDKDLIEKEIMKLGQALKIVRNYR